MAPYPVSSAYLVTQNYWRDLEFWNKSIVRHDVLPDTAHFSYTGYWFAKRPIVFDERTGAVASSPTRYAVQSVGESRFRIAGTVIQQTREALLVDAGRRWRLAWSTRGLAEDGWTLPSTPAVVRLYGDGGTAGARLRSLSLLFRAPEDAAHRRVVVASGADRRTLDVTPEGASADGLKVCVPAGGHADVRIGVDGASQIPGPQTTLAESLVPRRGGVLLARVALADEVGAPCA